MVNTPDNPVDEQSPDREASGEAFDPATDEWPTSAPTSDDLDSILRFIEQSLESGSDASGLGEQLARLHPADQAIVFDRLEPAACTAIVESLEPERIAGFVEHMAADEAIRFAGLVNPRVLADVLDRVEPDVAADILRGIGWDDASRILMRMSDRSAIGNLLLYRDEDAGGLMTTSVVALLESWPIPHAINMLRTSGLDTDRLRQLFVISNSQELVGRLELSELVFARPGSLVSDVMNPDVISVTTGTDQEEVARLMARYELRSVPVVDPSGRLEGAISIEDLVQVAEDEATEDMFRLAGTGREDTAQGPVTVSIKSRLPWLLANIATVVLVASVLALFENTLDSIAILAVYMPMVMNQAGVAGTQVTTVVVRSLALGEISSGSTGRLLRREYALATVNGLAVSLVMAVVVGLWRVDLYLGLVVFGAMLGSYFVAASVGVLVPMAMKRFNIDPATASGVVLTTFTDVAGGAFYLGLATIFLSLLKG